MFIIAGLGNPTLQYEGTRHNVGFDVIDMLADRYNISVDGRKGRALVGKGIIEGQKAVSYTHLFIPKLQGQFA